jgi:F420-dependent oxidoreductase-like protein
MQLRVFTEPQQGASYDTLLAVAQATEELGFDAFFRSDHYQHIGGGDGRPGSTDAWITLAALARETHHIRLGTLVTPVTFRQPGSLAISVAQVDAMSGGRVELGLGTGWFEDEHRAYGIPFPPTSERFDILEEQLAVVTGLWRTPLGERFSFAGSHYIVTDSPALPKPVQRDGRSGGPPIIIGGSGARRTPMLAASFAAEYDLPFGPPVQLREQAAKVAKACEQIGRDPSSIVLSAAATVCCGADDAEVARRAQAIGRTPKELRDHQLGGTPSEILDRLGEFADAGATRMYLQVLDLHDLDHLHLLAAEVLPHV